MRIEYKVYNSKIGYDYSIFSDKEKAINFAKSKGTEVFTLLNGTVVK